MQSRALRLLTIFFATLAVAIITHVIWQPKSIEADTTSYGYLQPQAGNTDNGGRHFVDLRNGNLWNCDFESCVLEGRPLLFKLI